MKIFLTGGSGFIGTHIRRKFENLDIVNFDIKKPEFTTTATYVKGDIRNFEEVKNAMIGCDIIIHLAAIWDDFSIDDSLYFDTNVNGTKVLIEAAIEVGIMKFVNYSSVSVYGENENECDELKTPLNPINAYGKSKAQAESLFEKWALTNPNISIIHLRPSVVFGENNYGNIYRLISQINSGFYFNINKANALKSITYVENLVDATFFLIQRMDNKISIFNYSDSPHMDASEISNVISDYLRKRRAMVFPFFLVYLMALPFDLYIYISKRNFPISTLRVKKYCTQTLNSNKKIIEEGFVPKFSSTEGLKKTCKWFLENSVGEN